MEINQVTVKDGDIEAISSQRHYNEQDAIKMEAADEISSDCKSSQQSGIAQLISAYSDIEPDSIHINEMDKESADIKCDNALNGNPIDEVTCTSNCDQPDKITAITKHNEVSNDLEIDMSTNENENNSIPMDKYHSICSESSISATVESGLQTTVQENYANAPQINHPIGQSKMSEVNCSTSTPTNALSDPQSGSKEGCVVITNLHATDLKLESAGFVNTKSNHSGNQAVANPNTTVSKPSGSMAGQPDAVPTNDKDVMCDSDERKIDSDLVKKEIPSILSLFEKSPTKQNQQPTIKTEFHDMQTEITATDTVTAHDPGISSTDESDSSDTDDSSSDSSGESDSTSSDEESSTSNSSSSTESSSEDVEVAPPVHMDVTPQANKPKLEDKSSEFKNILLESEPQIEDLDIVLTDDVRLERIGQVNSLIDQSVVVVKGSPNKPALNLNSVLFLENKTTLGRVYETFGPVTSPYYVICFKDRKMPDSLTMDQSVYFAPDIKDFTIFVLAAQLAKMKGSDASWRDDREPPASELEYSDDEQEKKAKRLMRNGSNRTDGDVDTGNNARKNPKGRWARGRGQNHWTNRSVRYANPNATMENCDEGWMNAIKNMSKQRDSRNQPPSNFPHPPPMPGYLPMFMPGQQNFPSMMIGPPGCGNPPRFVPPECSSSGGPPIQHHPIPGPPFYPPPMGMVYPNHMGPNPHMNMAEYSNCFNPPPPPPPT